MKRIFVLLTVLFTLLGTANAQTIGGGINNLYILGGSSYAIESNKLPGGDAAGTGIENKSILGTTNQVTVTHTAGAVTASIPNTFTLPSASPTFTGLSLSGLTGGYLPYIAPTTKTATDSPIFTDGSTIRLGTLSSGTPTGAQQFIIGTSTEATDGLKISRGGGSQAQLDQYIQINNNGVSNLISRGGTADHGYFAFDSYDGSSFVTRLYIDNAGNIGFNTATGFGTSLAKGIAIAEGTGSTTAPADVTQLWSANYNGTAGDNRLHIMGELSAVKTTAIGSGVVSIKGAVATQGGYSRQLAEATSGALSGASGSIAVNVPSGARILGVQLRVDTAITSGDGGTTWTAAYVNTPTTAICSGQAFTKSTKFSAIHPAYEIATGTVTIAITPNSGTFSAGVVRAVVYYESEDTVADAA